MGSGTGNVDVMAPRRRPRGSLDEPRKVGLWFEAVADDRLSKLATSVGATRSEFTQWLVENVPLDADGKPVGWDETHPNDEELPINSP